MTSAMWKASFGVVVWLLLLNFALSYSLVQYGYPKISPGLLWMRLFASIFGTGLAAVVIWLSAWRTVLWMAAGIAALWILGAVAVHFGLIDA